MSWGKRLAPLIATQAFLWLTFALFVFGPWRWPLNDLPALYLFLCASHFALCLGYLSAAHKASNDGPGGDDPSQLVRASLWITILILPLTSYARTGQWIPNVIGGLTNPGAAYMDAHVYSERTTNFAAYLRILAAPLLVVLFPLGVYSWSRLSWTMRCLLVASMVAVVLMSLATGQRRDIADLIVTIPFIVLAAHWAGVTRLSRRTIVVSSAAALLFLGAFSAYFAYSHISRVGRQAADYGVNPVTMQMPDLDNPILKAFPNEFQPGVVGLLNYLTTGYYGLGLALDRPVKPMYGFGHSMFLTRNFERLTNDPAFESRSLPEQISAKDGFTYPIFWCSAYPYFANDLGFIGTVIMLFAVGRGLALTWIDTLGGRNPHAVVFFCLLMTLVFYLPATNRMLQDGEGVSAFYGWLAIWLGARWVRRRSPFLATP
ncbi:MAG TPA: hypothetical protein VMI31_11910 [Fimbriimonadaceae bacterium]|nr:hypothetical protein [Fimbriimonadaceae bacterium]